MAPLKKPLADHIPSAAPVGQHVDLGGICVAPCCKEHDRLAVGRPAWARFALLAVGQLNATAAVAVHAPDVADGPVGIPVGLCQHVEHLRLSQWPFQILFLLFALLGFVFTARVLFGWVFPDVVFLGKTTLGLILNVVVIGSLAILCVQSMIGEFVIRNFTSLQRNPIYIIREKLTKYSD